MSYRDDRDAMLARNKALEQENERLRRELVEERAGREEPPREARSPGSGRVFVRGIVRVLRGAGRGLWVVGQLVRRARVPLAIGVLVIGGIVTFARCDAVAKLFRPKASSTQAMIVEADSGAVVVVLAGYYGKKHTRYEVSSFDLRSGKQVGTLKLGRDALLFKPVGGRAWVRHADGKLALLDLVRSRVELSHRALVAKVPELAPGYRAWIAWIDEYSPPMAAVPVNLHDGHVGWIDMTPALQRSSPSTEPQRPDYYCDPDDRAKPSCDRTECIGFVSLPGMNAHALASTRIWGHQRGRTVPIGEEASPLFRPDLVQELDTACAFETDDSVLVLHDSAVLESKDILVSLVEHATGQIRWTRRSSELTDRSRSKALGARVVDGEIVLLLHDDRGTLDLVRLSLSGEVLARHRLL